MASGGPAGRPGGRYPTHGCMTIRDPSAPSARSEAGTTEWSVSAERRPASPIGSPLRLADIARRAAVMASLWRTVTARAPSSWRALSTMRLGRQGSWRGTPRLPSRTGSGSRRLATGTTSYRRMADTSKAALEAGQARRSLSDTYTQADLSKGRIGGHHMSGHFISSGGHDGVNFYPGSA
jgi:hypothetical protein